MTEHTMVGRINRDGKGSYKVAVTGALKALDLHPGDYVRITISPIDLEDRKE